jgi:hypothetical protein
LGNQHPDVVISLNNLGLLSKTKRQSNLAKSYYLEALEIAETYLETSHPSTIMVRRNLEKLRALLN